MSPLDEESELIKESIPESDEVERIGEEMMNPSRAGSGVVTWRNLRLSAAIQGSKQQALGRTAQAVRKASTQVSGADANNSCTLPNTSVI